MIEASTDAPLAPPQNLEAERELLGALLTYYSPRIVAEIKQTGLTPLDFYYASHAAVFGAIVSLDADEEFVDIRTVSRRLGTGLPQAGGDAGLELLSACAAPWGICERARMIVEDSRWRARLDGAYDVIEACHLRDSEAYSSALELVTAELAA